MKLKKFQEKELTIIEYEDIIEIGKVFKGGQRIRKKSGNEINTILEKLEKDKYQYFVSRDFNSTNIEDLKDIYRNLLFIKNSFTVLAVPN